MFYEKLFLDESKSVVISENHTQKLKQHQIDGLRFIYYHYKRAPGIIVNDPAGSGRSVQIILFIDAIKHLLQHPVLLLCSNHYVDKFKILYHDWFPDDPDVIFDSTKPFVHKKIFVNSWNELPSLSRREWSVVVVYNEECSASFMKTLTSLKAGYKIVVITIDLKKNIKSFTNIYTWINNNKMNIDKLPSTLRTLNHIILLDHIFENKVLRRNNEGSTFETIQVNTKTNVIPQEKTFKNKDITGTKIKRSKKNNNENLSMISKAKELDESENTLVNVPGSIEGNQRKRKIPRFVESDDEDEVVMKDYNKNTVKQMETDIINAAVISNKSLVSKDETIIPETNVTNDNTVVSNVLSENSSVRAENIETKPEIEIGKFDIEIEEHDITLKMSDDEASINLEENIECDKTENHTENSNFTHTNNKLNDSVQLKDENNCDAFVNKDILHKNNVEKSPIESNNINESALFYPKLANEEITGKKQPSLLEKDESSVNECTKSENQEINLDVKNEPEIFDTKGSSDVNQSIDDYDRKLKELEESILKKFKGSILDKLF